VTKAPFKSNVKNNEGSCVTPTLLQQESDTNHACN